jgi:hypothetical protein
MSIDPSVAKAKLAAFKRRKKFSDAEWKKRGLLPSGAAVSASLETLFNRLAGRLVTATREPDLPSTAERLLKRAVGQIDRDKYDTEEAEFVCAVFAILAGIFELKLGAPLNRWLYGEALGEAAFESAERLKQSPAIQTLSQPCTKCAVAIETAIMTARPDNNFESWLAVECASCGELNFLVLPPGIGSMHPNGWKMAAQYWRDQFNRQSAEATFKETYAKQAKRAASSRRRNAA